MTRRTVVWVALTALAMTMVCGCGERQRVREAQLIAQIDSLRAFIRSTRSMREDWEKRAIPVLVDRHDVEAMQDRGLADPLVALAKDLRSHPELIPLNPVPRGAKFAFYDSNGIQVLTDKWVLAEFDDGLGGGEMLLQYSVGDSGRISWKPLLWAWDGPDESTHPIK